MAPEVCYAFRCLKTHKALDAPDDLSPPSGQTSPTPRHALDAAHRQKNRYESWIDVEASSASGVLKVLSAAWWLGVMRCTLPGAGKLLDFTHRPIDPSPPVATRRHPSPRRVLVAQKIDRNHRSASRRRVRRVFWKVLSLHQNRRAMGDRRSARHCHWKILGSN